MELRCRGRSTPPPLGLVRLHTLLPLALPPVEKNLDLPIPRELLPQLVAETRFFLRHDEQVSSHIASSYPDSDLPVLLVFSL